MADRIIKGDSGNDVIIQNNDASRKIEVTNSGDVEVTGDVKTTTVKATNLKANDGTDALVVSDSTGQITSSVKIDLNGNELILDADADSSITADTDDQIDFRAGGSDSVKIDNQNLTINNGNLVIGTANKGIDFSGAQTAIGTTDNEVFSGYERGDFVPGVAFGGGATGITYNTTFTKGTYVKMGDLVFISGYIIVTDKGSSSGSATITGLPFQIRNNNDAYGMITIKVVDISFADVPTCSLVIGSTTCSLRETTNAGVQTHLTEGNFGTAPQIMFSGHYTIFS